MIKNPSEFEPPVNATIDPALTGPHGAFSRFDIDPAATGFVLHSIGVSPEDIGYANVVADTAIPEDAPGRPRYATYGQRVFREVKLHPNNVVVAMEDIQRREADRQQDDLKRLAEETNTEVLAEAKDLSAHLVGALSKYADDVMMGHDGLDAEFRAVQRAITARKAIPRVLGGVAAAAISLGAAYANMKYEIVSVAPADVIFGAVAVGSLVESVRSSRLAGIKGLAERIQWNQLPGDKRAKERMTQYREDRAAGTVPELVSYELRDQS